MWNNEVIRQSVSDYRFLIKELAWTIEDLMAIISWFNYNGEQLRWTIANMAHVKTAVSQLSSNWSWPLETVTLAERDLSQSDVQMSVVEKNSQEVLTFLGKFKWDLTNLLSAVSQWKSTADNLWAISRTTNLLWINATIEAAHSSDKGRWFLIIAKQVKELSQEAGKSIWATTQNFEQIETLAQWIATATEQIIAVLNTTSELMWTVAWNVSTAKTAVGDVKDWISLLNMTSEEVDRNVWFSVSSVEWVLSWFDSTVDKLVMTNQRLQEIIKRCQTTPQVAADKWIDTEDTTYYNILKGIAWNIEWTLQRSIDKWEITEEQLFDRNYVPIEWTDPIQHKTKYNSFFDSKLADMQEAVLKEDWNIVFCVATDNNWYISTHNLNFSLRQIPVNTDEDRNRNKAKSRNRTIFLDEVWQNGSKNTEKKILVQIYLREMWDKLVPMIDISTPIYVKTKSWKKHWGAIRMWYKL